MMRIKKLKPLNRQLNNKISSLVMNSQATELKSGDAGNRSPSRLRSKHERRPAKPKPNGELNRGNTLQKWNAKPKPGAAKPSSHGVKQAAQEQKFEAEMDPRPNRTQPLRVSGRWNSRAGILEHAMAHGPENLQSHPDERTEPNWNSSRCHLLWVGTEAGTLMRARGPGRANWCAHTRKNQKQK
jgi:hypothetical protein